jgi:hypothetical protein
MLGLIKTTNTISTLQIRTPLPINLYPQFQHQPYQSLRKDKSRSPTIPIRKVYIRQIPHCRDNIRSHGHWSSLIDRATTAAEVITGTIALTELIIMIPNVLGTS